VSDSAERSNQSQCRRVVGPYRPDAETLGTIGAQSARVAAITQSTLLAALPLAEQARLRPELESISLASQDVVYEAGEDLQYVYFPISCIVSLVYTTVSGVTAGIGLIGNEGAVGIATFTGGETMPNRAVVLIPGGALRMKATAARKEFRRGGPLQQVLLQYMHAFFTQTSQTAVCCRLHLVEQRLCQWILLCHDRLQSDELQMTQESISNMLSARRQSVTVASGHLQAAGLIRCARGRITILDRGGLERTACECYQVIKTEYDRLTGVEGTVA
jgi:CRP-like cAMP-binding protein